MEWVKHFDLELTPPEHGGHGWIVRYPIGTKGGYYGFSDNPRHWGYGGKTLNQAIEECVAKIKEQR